MHGAIAIKAKEPLDRAKVALYGVAVGGAVAMLAMRIWLGWDLPLWLDETWTAVIANQPTWSTFWREAWLDCNAPLYYAFMALWTDVAGMSNWALRAPSLIFISLAAATPLVWRAPGLSRDASIAWAALLFFWWPGIAISLDARVYSMLLFVSVLQSLAFIKLIEKPTTRLAWLWAALASLAFVCHYYSAYVTAAQAGVYLWFHWRTFWRVLPIGLAFVPSFAWAVYHLPRLADYARPDIAWYEAVDIWGVIQFVLFVIGPSAWPFPLIMAVGFLAVHRWGKGPRDEELHSDRALWAGVASGVIALAIALIVGMIRPSLTDRYLVPIAPLTLLGLVMLARLLPKARLAYALLCGLFLSMSLSPEPLSRRMQGRSTYGYEEASYYVMKARPDRLVFAWDHPAMGILDQGSVRQIGGFFFERAGVPVETVPIVLDPFRDPNPVLAAAAKGAERPVIIWLYNRARRSAAGKYEPRLDLMGWRCSRRNRKPDIGIMACSPPRLLQ